MSISLFFWGHARARRQVSGGEISSSCTLSGADARLAGAGRQVPSPGTAADESDSGWPSRYPGAMFVGTRIPG
ncbi:hypothetical protein [Burkholderia sp. WAC0059]|uniref:hypothetical protein n=1 Tax=Burkholderia sp. WAC0059 TaxID=2066022 RepID=UPI0011AFABB4|nr:hypothetical protein [Burkholderia sp. WAC0059]